MTASNASSVLQGSIISSGGYCWQSYGTALAVKLQTCNSSLSSQLFSIASSDAGTTILTYDGLCLDFIESAPDDSTPVITTAPCEPDASAQVWEPSTNISDGAALVWVDLINNASGQCVTQGPGEQSPGMTVVLSDCTGFDDQSLVFEAISESTSVTVADKVDQSANTETVNSATPAVIVTSSESIVSTKSDGNHTTANPVIMTKVGSIIPLASTAPTAASNTTGVLSRLVNRQTVKPKTTRIKTSTGKCWSVGPTSNHPILAVACNATDPLQQFSYAYGNIVITARGIGCVQGKALVVRLCSPDSSQLFFFKSPTGTVVSGSTYACADIVNGAIVTGACKAGRSSQQMTIENPDIILPWNGKATPSQCNKTAKQPRMEWRDMNNTQKLNYINAVNQMRSAKSMAGRRGYYDDLVAIHSAAAGFIHGGSVFLPWHRWFLRIYEIALQSFNPEVTVPYWDWSIDGPEPLQDDPLKELSEILGASSAAFGTRNGDASGCVSDGCIKDWTDADGNCIARNYSDDFAVPARSSISLLVNNAPDWGDFSSGLEDFHNTVHENLGGDGGDLYYINYSPNDPLFFLHHCFIDHLWALWQQSHPALAQSYYGGFHSPAGWVTETDAKGYLMSFNVPISSTLVDSPDNTCVTYAESKLGPSILVKNVGVTARSDTPKSKKKHHKRVGSGRHGTIPSHKGLRPPSDDFLKMHHPMRMFGREPSPEQEEHHIKSRRMRDRLVLKMEQEFVLILDNFLATGVDYETAFEEAVKKTRWKKY